MILSGYYGPDIEGVAQSIPIELYSQYPSPCQNCLRHADSFFFALTQDSSEYLGVINKLKALTSLAPISFQGARESDRFTVGGGGPFTQNTSVTTPVDRYSDRTFRNYVELENKVVLLPDGPWETLGYVKQPSARGEDHFLILSQRNHDTLTNLLMIRLQTARDHGGFGQYPACKQSADYAHKVRYDSPTAQQSCYWASYVGSPWQQPIYKLAASRLTNLGLPVPSFAIGMGFHEADGNSSLTTLYYSFPKSPAGESQKAWRNNPWNPAQISKSQDKSTFLQGQLTWAEDWFQIFATSH
ncbi:hypothetical protein [Pseudomonas zhanjiangensis]|uniref:Tle cognate immunity protein 4 C-terminal domain-containing protein n=1 Tax=Pseudomonas zhanjiangensis TaxID=3239015 RepID=A0ABV3YPX6_9PSED